MSGDNIPASKIMALGRPFKIGMLYDFKTDKLIPNILLWDEKIISEHLIYQSLSSSSVEIYKSNTFKNLADLLGIDDNLKLSVLAGLMELSGSAKLINYCQTNEEEVRFILRYSITTHFHQLQQHRLTKNDIKNREVFDQQIATHVVINVVYGAEIFFVFKRDLFDNENRDEIYNSVERILRKTRTIQLVDNDQLDLSDHEKKLADTLTCQYYGDIQLEVNPTSFKEAVNLLKLPNLLGKHNKNAIPQQVSIYPLYLLDNFFSSKKRFHQIDNDILRKSVEIMDSLQQLEFTLSDIKNSLTSMKMFYRSERQWSLFCTQISEVGIDMRKQMANLLPKIRDESLEETLLTHLMKNINLSPSNKQKVNKFIQLKTEEINVLKLLTNDLRKENNIHLLSSSSSFDQIQKDCNCEFILCLFIHVIEKNDRVLNELFQYITDYVKQQDDQDIEINQWFNQNNLVLIQKESKRFTKFAKDNNDKTNINKPGQPYATDAFCQNTTLNWAKPFYGSESIQQYKIYGQSNLNHQWKLLLITANAIQSAILSSLAAGKYQFKIQGITLVGCAATSDASDIITVVNDLSTEEFLLKQSLLSAGKSYYEECKEYYQLTKQPLISVTNEVLDDNIELKSSSIIIGIDEDYGQFDLQGFLRKFCNTLNLELSDMVVKQIQSGSAILEVEIKDKFQSNDKKLHLRMIYHKLTDELQKQLAKMKIFFMFMGTVKSLVEIQKYRSEIKLNPQYNRKYIRGHAYWQGALNDGIDRGNQPYYCPVGWQRCSFYVTDNFDKKFKGWCICYHGTKFSYGLSILLSGLKPAERAEHGKGIYVTPSITYACHPRYAEVKFIQPSARDNLFKSVGYIQFVLECRVHPNNIRKIRKETLDAGNTIIDSNINNDIIEWVIHHKNKAIVDFNDPESSIICTGLLTRFTNKHPGLIPDSQWWYESHLCNNPKCCCLGIDRSDLEKQKQNGDICNIIFH